MDYRFLGASGLRVSALSFGTMTFGGTGRFADVGTTGAEEARSLVDQCLEAGVNLFDTADMYSGGLSEEILAPRVKRPAHQHAVPPAGYEESERRFHRPLDTPDTFKHRSSVHLRVRVAGSTS